MTKTPDFYDEAKIGTLFYPDMAAIGLAADSAELPVAATDDLNVHLLLIDMQVDFCHEQGNLYVPGSQDDIARVCDFMVRNAAAITQVSATIDSHNPFQIFHPSWWVDADGNHPAPFTLISHADVLAGTWHALVAPEFSAEYTRQLEEGSKKILTIWPYHCLIGSPGAMIDPMLWSMISWHALARNAQPNWVTKGTIAQTEHYSAIKPEIAIPGHPGLGVERDLMARLEASDVIILAGEAESHCVLATLGDIVAQFADRPERLKQIYVLQDCMSPVLHPEIDFHALAMEQFAVYEKMGVQLVNSAENLPFLSANLEVANSATIHGVTIY